MRFEIDTHESLAGTDNRSIDRFLMRFTGSVRGGNGQWSFEHGGVRVMLVSDEIENRMRIVAPIIEVDKLGDADLRELMSANFDRAIDARYAIWQEMLWSVYVHPLRELTEWQLEDAIRQVVTLRTNFGTTYSAGSLLFKGGFGRGEN